MTKSKQVLVIGASDESNYLDETYAIGKYIAEKNYLLITGGGSGIMEAASRGASENNGTTLGIIPGDSKESANKYCSIVVSTGMGHARNVINVLSADIVIAIGGKAGTLTELAYAWQYRKPIICCTFAGGWSKDITKQPIDDRSGGKIYCADSIEEVFRYIDEL